MLPSSIDRAFRRFQRSGDPGALAQVFDEAAPRLSGLAAHLASPEASAEDLLQTTFLTAIESRHRYDSSQPLLPWLAGILANHARDARRRQRREFDPERLVEARVETPIESAASAELRAELERSIASLPEQYRPVLRLYLESGLEPGAIAHSLERPPGTVRAQLSRGLEQLRRRLPSSLLLSHGFAFVSLEQLAGLRARLLAQLGSPLGSATRTTPLVRFLTMSLNKKILMGCAVLLIALVSNRIWSQGSPETLSVVDAANVERVEPLAAVEVAPPSSRESRTEAALPVETILQPSTAAPRKTTRLVVHVQDSTGLAQPNIGVAMQTDDLQKLAVFLDFRPTDASGNVTFEDVPARFVSLQLDRNAAMARMSLNQHELNEETIQISGMRVLGRVVDERGAPVPDATIWAQGQRLEAVRIAVADDRGEFRLEQISPGVVLQARHAGFAPSSAHPALGKEGERWDLRMELDSNAREVSGRVVDPAGQPVEGALVAFVSQSGKAPTAFEQNQPLPRGFQLRTNADGTFRTSEVPREALVVNAVGRNPDWTFAGASLEAGSASEHVELRLQVGAVLEGTITDAGVPQRGCPISTFSVQPEVPVSSLFQLLGVRAASTDKQGRFRIAGIVPGQVEMRARRSGAETLGEQTLPLTAGQVCQWDLECSASPGFPFEISVEPKSSSSRPWHVLVVSRDATDKNFTIYPAESGLVRIKRLKEGRYKATVVYSPEPGEMLALFSQEFDAGERRLALRIPEERLHFQDARGRLTDSSGAALPARALQVHALDQEGVLILQRSTDASGVFSVAALAPGRYAIEVRHGEGVKLLREFTMAGDRVEELGDIVAP